ncbi:MAG: hypothetical protein EXQ56_01280 [Acidobacteria bacterium]|nr:hypothetical protein [Acidobacteriota bacterium]
MNFFTTYFGRFLGMLRRIAASSPVEVPLFGLMMLALMLGIATPRRLFAQDAATGAGSNAPAATEAMPLIRDEEVVLAVGNIKITAAEFKEILGSLPPQFAALYGQMGAKAFAEQYASLLGLSQEAEKREFDKTDQFRRMFEFERRVVLAQVMANQITSTAGSVSDEEVNYYYTTHESEFEQLKVRGIFIPVVTSTTRATVSAAPPGTPRTGAKPQYNEQMGQRRALQIRSLVISGMADMAALAKTDSDHPTSAKGGDFGFVRRGELPPAVSTTVFGMQVNQVSAPLRDKSATKGGFYIFRVEAKRLQPLAEVKEGIRSSLSMEKLNTYLLQIRENYPVTYHPTFYNVLEPAKPAASTAPAPASGGR